MPEWSRTDQLGGKGIMTQSGLSFVRGASFGLAGYCLDTRIPDMFSDSGYHSVCFVRDASNATPW